MLKMICNTFKDLSILQSVTASLPVVPRDEPLIDVQTGCRQHLHLQHAGPGALPSIHLPQQHTKCVGVGGLGQAALQQVEPAMVSLLQCRLWIPTIRQELRQAPVRELWQAMRSMA